MNNESFIAEIFSENLKFLRIRRSMSREKLAEILNVSPATISNYENCTAWPTLKNFCALAEALDAKPYEFLIDVSSELYEFKSSVMEKVREKLESVESNNSGKIRKRAVNKKNPES